MEVMAVDWSGALAPGKLWWATARDGRLVDVGRSPSREALVKQIVDHGTRVEGPLVVGLDFAFSLPHWYLERHGFPSAPALWAFLADHAEDLLAECEPPFWGRPGRKRPALPQHLRRTDGEVGAVGGIRPKSVFQIGGAGAVGTGSLRGMPFLIQLQDAGYAIWPFDAPTDRTVIEIYPRLLTGPVVKSDPAARQTVLARLLAEGALDPAQAARAVVTEDSFDAAVSAVAMSTQGASLAALRRTTDPVTLLEGEIWEPPGAAGSVLRSAEAPGVAEPADPAVERHPPSPTPPSSEPLAVAAALARRVAASGTTPSNVPAYSARYVAALGFAATLHVTQRRKGSPVPYVAHLLTVSALVFEAGGDEDQAIAGLLHDAVEDRGGPPTLEAIRAQFGERVARIVDACTDATIEPKPPWLERKRAHLARLQQAPSEVLLVVAADKLHNATSTVWDVRQQGDGVWDRFRGGRDGTLWYYGEMGRLLAERLPCALVDRLEAVVAELVALAGP